MFYQNIVPTELLKTPVGQHFGKAGNQLNQVHFNCYLNNWTYADISRLTALSGLDDLILRLKRRGRTGMTWMIKNNCAARFVCFNSRPILLDLRYDIARQIE